MRMDQDNRSLAKTPRQSGSERLQGWGTLAFVAVTALAGCGETSREPEGDELGGSGSGAGRGGSGSGTGVGAVSGGGLGGTAGTSGISLNGSPQHFRFVRLTNSQWAASVQEVLKLAEPSGLEQTFPSAVAGITDFTNNELVLDVDPRSWEEFQLAAEALASQVTASDEALAAVYAGTDSAGFIETVGRRAYRRPLTREEAENCTRLFKAGADLPGTRSVFAKGAELVIRALLQSPHFLYRTELGAEGEPLSGYEAAAKLSLLLRDSTPDEALLDKADELSSVDVLADEATRMLHEAPATGVMRQFHGELLHLGRLREVNKINTPGFDPAVNPELEESSFLFFDKIFSEGLGVRDILTSTRGFVGPGMAPLYGLSVQGSGFVEKELGPRRAGFFSQLPFLMLYAHNEAPDSIHRGISLALDVLCSPLGPPVAEIPPLAERRPGETSRQRIDSMTQGCANVCHNEIINPLGFAFEHFDGMGQYRDTEVWQTERLAIDSSGSYAFMDGRVAFADNVELMQAMATRPDAHLCYAKKLASFALQRDIVVSDLPWLNELAQLSLDTASTQDLMLKLVTSDVFRTHVGGKL